MFAGGNWTQRGDLVDPPRARRPEVDVLSLERWGNCWRRRRGTGWRARHPLAVSLGLRRGELLGLRWQDVDLDAGHTPSARAPAGEGQGLILTEPKSTTSRRTINLPQIALTALRGQKLRQKQEERWGAPVWQDNEFVFTSTIRDGRWMVTTSTGPSARFTPRPGCEPAAP